MKIVIDVPKNRYEEICSGIFDVDGYFKVNLTLAFRKGTPLPENATNGDMIKVVFPNGKTIMTNGLEIGYRPAKPNDKWIIWFMQDWWNAPYKRGDVNGNS